jgi:hypothetical protein
LPGASDADGGVRLALNATDVPHIAYFDPGQRAVMHASNPGAGWTISRVDESHLEGHVGLALAQDGTPHLAYAWDNGRLRHAWWTGGGWSTETVDSNVVTARYTSVAIQPDGRPHIAYYGNGQLWYARWIGFRWELSVVDPTTSPDFVGIQSNASGGRWIAYRARTEQELRVAQWNGSAWIREVVDSEGDVGWDASLALDTSGRPHISYYDRDVAILRYARQEEGGWSLHIPDRRFVTGWFSSVVIDASGQPHFAYYSWPERSVRYAAGGFGIGVRTWPPRSISPSSAIVVGELTSIGNATTIDVHFEWRAARGDWVAVGVTTVSERGFTSLLIEGLEPSTAYQVRFVATVGTSTYAGETITFSTAAPLPPRGADPVLVVSIFVAAVVGLVALGYLLARRASAERIERLAEDERPTSETGDRGRIL